MYSLNNLRVTNPGLVGLGLTLPRGLSLSNKKGTKDDDRSSTHHPAGSLAYELSMTTSVLISPVLNLKGSSVDLAPGLMNLYDSYNATDTKGVDSRLTASELHLPALQSTGTSDVRHGHSPSHHRAAGLEQCNNNIVPAAVNHSYVPDNIPNMKESATTPVVNPNTHSCGGGSSGGSEGLDHHLPISPLHHTDAKKRPLSVSSTASSSSSTSSLPRQQRKKVATNLVTTSSLAGPSLAGVGGGSGGGDSGLYACSTVRTLATAAETQDNGYGQQMELGGEEEDFHIMDQVPEEVEVDLQQHLASESDTSGCRSPPQSPLSNKSYSLQEYSQAYIDKVVAEILATERTYVQDLSDIIQGYLDYINNSPQLAMCPEDITALFGNIEAIYDFNRDFLEHLEQCDSDPVRLAECFVNKNAGFVIYTDYCTNYPRAVEVLTQCMRMEETAEAFKQQQKALEHGLPLGSYLLKPVQRILKYHLLLQAILNYYDKTKPGLATIELALESMTSMAQHINEMKRKHEHAVRIQEIQSTLYGWEGADLTTFGDLVLENQFRVQGAKASRQIFLFEKGLLIAKKREDGYFVCKGNIMCSNLMLVESIPKEPLSFHVIPFDNPRMQYTIQAKNLEQKRTWCYEVKRLMLENYNAVIPDKAKELVMKLGKSREEEDLDNSNVENVEPSRKQHSAPEYLERRRGRRRSTSIIPDFGLLKAQRARRGSRKSESPKSSPKHRRKSDITRPFSPLILRGDSDNDDIKEETSETEKEEEEEQEQQEQQEPKPSKRVVRSLSLESIHNLLSGSELKATEIDTGAEKTAPRPVSFDDSCSRADKISEMLAAEGLAAQLGHKNSSDIDWDENMVSSVLSISSVKRAESFKIATELNRVDSVSVAKTRRARLLQQRSQISTQSTDEESVTTVLCAGDGHARLSQDEGLLNCESPTSLRGSSPRRDRVNSGVKTSASPFQSAEVITNQHAKSTDSLDRVVSNGGSDVEGDETGHYDNVTVGVYDNVILNNIKSGGGRCHSRPSSASCSWQGGYPSVGSPTLSTSSRHGDDQAAMSPSVDPWIPQTLDSRRAKVIARQHSMGSADLLKRPVLKSPMIKRSNSMSSLSESKEDLVDDPEPVRSRHGHLRMPSDTLIFANRSAFLASPSLRTIRHDPSIQRAITRLATPPRDFGPPEMIRQIQLSRENGRTVTRYATPPRSFSDDEAPSNSTGTVLVNNYSCDLEKEIFETLKSCDGAASHSTSSTPTHSAHRVPLHMCRSPILGNKPTTVDLSSPAHSRMWHDFEEYLSHSPDTASHVLPQFPVPEIQVHRLAPRPDSFCVPSSVMTRGHQCQTHQRSASSPHSPIDLSSPSPCSTTSNDSVVDSLKQAFMNFTSKLTGRSSRSVETSPSRSPRARSASAIDQLGVSPECHKSPRHRDKSEKSKDKRKFVNQLARVYNDRFKPRNRQGSDKRRREKDLAMTKELTSLLKDSKQGGSTIGERMALNKPIILGTYTLQRHRPPRPRKVRDSGDNTPTSGRSSREMTPEAQVVTFEVPSEVIKTRGKSAETGDTKGTNSNHDSGCLEDDVFKGVEVETPVTSGHQDCDMRDTQTELDHQDDPSQTESLTLPSDAFKNILIATETGDKGVSEQEEMYECYYERKFAEDLETSLADEVFRDSAVYSDDGAVQEGEMPASTTKLTIRDTVKMIEQRSRTRPVHKIQVRRDEKAQGLHSIMKSLEGSTSPLAMASPETGRRTSETVAERSVKSVRERTRELVECATLTRIRQNSCNIGDEHRMGAVAEAEDLQPVSPANKGNHSQLSDGQFLSSESSA